MEVDYDVGQGTLPRLCEILSIWLLYPRNVPMSPSNRIENVGVFKKLHDEAHRVAGCSESEFIGRQQKVEGTWICQYGFDR